MAKKLNMQGPFPDVNILPLTPDGRWSRAWFEFLLLQYRRSGDASGIDTAALKAKIDELEMLVNADPSAAIIAVLLQRVAMLETLVMSMPVPVPARAPAAMLPDVVIAAARPSATLPDPVAVPAHATAQLPDPLPVAPRAPDDIRKLIEA
ncbi:TPA: hypothetical protein ACT5B7_006633 [Burkholderia cenocepacia]